MHLIAATTDLSIPEPSTLDTRWGSLPLTERFNVDRWLTAFRKAGGITKPVSRCARLVAALIPGMKPKTARNKIEAYELSGRDWYALVDKRKLAAEATNPRNCVANSDFQTLLKRMVEEEGLSTAQAFDRLLMMWRMKEPIDGYDGHPGWPQIPTGWSHRNLYRKAPAKDTTTASRIGIVAAAEYLPMVRTTRTNLWPGAIYFFDDVWHDNYVRVGLKAVTRVLELGVMDAFSGCRFHLGMKPRMPKADKSGNAGIKKREMLWFLVEVLMRFGWSKRGTELRAEHGTAAISEAVEMILKRISGGLISVQRSGIIGEQQALIGDAWRGRGKGNPKAKGMLESFHRVYHNIMGTVIGQTGPNRQKAPEMTGIPTLGLSDDPAAIARRVQSFITSGHKLPVVPYQQALLEAATLMRPEVQAMLIHPLLEFFSQFHPTAVALNHALNCRTRHTLEGWEELGFRTVEYFDAESGAWLLAEDVAKLPPDRFLRISECVKANPKAFTRPRSLSPWEVWETRSDMVKLSPIDAIEILGTELAEVRKVDGAYIHFKDGDISPTDLYYRAELTRPDGTTEILRHGEKVLAYCNPYNPEFLTIVDEHYRFRGLVPRDHKVDQGSKEELARAYADKAHRSAVRLQEFRQRHAGTTEAIGALKEANVAAIVHGTEEDRAAARSAAAKDGLKTAAANRLKRRGNARDWNAEVHAAAEATEAPEAIDPLAGLPD